MSEEEYREWSPDDGPEDEPDRDSKAWLVYVQPDLRRSATATGNFRRCRLPKCRRMRQCAGRHPIEKIGTSPWYELPPCVDNNDARAALIAENRRRIAEMRDALIAQGVDPKLMPPD